MTLEKIKKLCYLLRSCLVDAKRMLLFMVEQVFLLMGEVLLMRNADTQCTVGGERRPKGREEFLCLNFSLDFPGGPVVKNPPFNAGDAGSIPGQGTKIPHAVG